MTNTNMRLGPRLRAAAAVAMLAAAGMAAQAQDSGGSAGPAPAAGAEPGTTATPAGATPWYLGASESLTRDSNVYRVPGGPGDTYSSTSLLGGFDQHIGRQRVFGNANVGINRYDGQSRLNNTSYNVAGGLD
ncbi:MAG TPA: hypothetical protein VFF72_06680, partial [Caldimonas sp.]|nr:hypothetical protein [Caldimonas sp.]